MGMKLNAATGINGDNGSIGVVLKNRGNFVLLLLVTFFLCLALAGCDRGPVAPATPPNVVINGQVFIVTKGGENFKLGLVKVFISDKSSVEEDVKKFGQMMTEDLAKAKAGIDAETPGYLAAKDKYNQAKASYDNADQALQKALSGRRSMLYGSNTVDGVDPSEASRIIKLDRALVAEGLKTESLYNDAVAKNKSLRSLLSYQHIYLKNAHTFITVYSSGESIKTDADGKFSLSVPAGNNYVIMASASRSVGDNNEEYNWIVDVDATKADHSLTVLLSNDNLVDSVPGLLLTTKPSDSSELAELPFDYFTTKPTSYIFKNKTGDNIVPDDAQTGGVSDASAVSPSSDATK